MKRSRQSGTPQPQVDSISEPLPEQTEQDAESVEEINTADQTNEDEVTASPQQHDAPVVVRKRGRPKKSDIIAAEKAREEEQAALEVLPAPAKLLELYRLLANESNTVVEDSSTTTLFELVDLMDDQFKSKWRKYLIDNAEYEDMMELVRKADSIERSKAGSSNNNNNNGDQDNEDVEDEDMDGDLISGRKSRRAASKAKERLSTLGSTHGNTLISNMNNNNGTSSGGNNNTGDDGKPESVTEDRRPSIEEDLGIKTQTVRDAKFAFKKMINGKPYFSSSYQDDQVPVGFTTKSVSLVQIRQKNRQMPKNGKSLTLGDICPPIQSRTSSTLRCVDLAKPIPIPDLESSNSLCPQYDSALSFGSYYPFIKCSQDDLVGLMADQDMLNRRYQHLKSARQKSNQSTVETQTSLVDVVGEQRFEDLVKEGKVANVKVAGDDLHAIAKSAGIDIDTEIIILVRELESKDSDINQQLGDLSQKLRQAMHCYLQRLDSIRCSEDQYYSTQSLLSGRKRNNVSISAGKDISGDELYLLTSIRQQLCMLLIKASGQKIAFRSEDCSVAQVDSLIAERETSQGNIQLEIPKPPSGHLPMHMPGHRGGRMSYGAGGMSQPLRPGIQWK
ncbi:hypothetical protein MIR68_008296 [Amoeboaphelidium protococcarum]|nr:hypothetical protein MIR68_008296 [Amoeboaphelidium protococcarum]